MNKSLRNRIVRVARALEKLSSDSMPITLKKHELITLENKPSRAQEENANHK